MLLRAALRLSGAAQRPEATPKPHGILPSRRASYQPNEPISNDERYEAELAALKRQRCKRRLSEAALARHRKLGTKMDYHLKEYNFLLHCHYEYDLQALRQRYGVADSSPSSSDYDRQVAGSSLLASESWLYAKLDLTPS